jgi:predicted metal-dependent phosphotriesterase family hydrolase
VLTGAVPDVLSDIKSGIAITANRAGAAKNQAAAANNSTQELKVMVAKAMPALKAAAPKPK